MNFVISIPAPVCWIVGTVLVLFIAHAIGRILYPGN